MPGGGGGESIRAAAGDSANMTKHDIEQFFGYAGATFLSLVLLPQVWITLRDRSDHSSAWFLVLEILASSCFVAYGALLPSNDGLPVIISNASAFLCTCVLIGAKIAFKKQPQIIRSEKSGMYGAVVDADAMHGPR